MRLGGKDIELKPGTLAAKLFDNAAHHPPALPPPL